MSRWERQGYTSEGYPPTSHYFGTAIALILSLLAGCATIPEHCRSWGNPKQCARDHPEGEFFCDDTPERDPERCGLE